jgi:hypothetical protein
MQPTSSYIPENRSDVTSTDPPQVHQDETKQHYERIEQELRAAGMSWFGLRLMESHYLPRVIHQNETIKGVAYGWQPGGIVMLVATDHRIIFLDKKPLFLRDDEVSYDSVRGISYYHAGLASTAVLHTQVQDYIIRTFNKISLQKFIDYIELRSFEHMKDEDIHND